MELQVSGVVVRLVFRIIFTALFLYLSLVGTLCNQFARKRQLLRDGRIRIIETAGWLDLGGLFDGLRNIKRVPHVKWWLAMLVVAVLSMLTDFATTAVQQKYINGFCEFGTGMVLAMNGSEAFFAPPSNGRPVFVAGTAQTTSHANGCPEGIYRKVNSNSHFCAAQSDILGSWTCKSVGGDITYEYGKYTYKEIAHDLIEKGLLYPATVTGETKTPNPHRFSHLVAWSTSSYDESNDLWDVKASVDLSARNTDDKVMHSMHCTMNAPNAEAINRGIASFTALEVWVELLQGYMYYGFNSSAIDDPENTLAWYLNTMIMVAGGNDDLLSKPPSDDSKQGCLVLTTEVPWWLIALLFLTILVCIVITALTLYLHNKVRGHKNAELVKHAPIDLWTWMAQAVAESNARQDDAIAAIEPKNLHRWNIVIGDDSGVRVEKRAEEVELLTNSKHRK